MPENEKHGEGGSPLPPPENTFENYYDSGFPLSKRIVEGPVSAHDLGLIHADSSRWKTYVPGREEPVELPPYPALTNYSLEVAQEQLDQGNFSDAYRELTRGGVSEPSRETDRESRIGYRNFLRPDRRSSVERLITPEAAKATRKINRFVRELAEMLDEYTDNGKKSLYTYFEQQGKQFQVRYSTYHLEYLGPNEGGSTIEFSTQVTFKELKENGVILDVVSLPNGCEELPCCMSVIYSKNNSAGLFSCKLRFVINPLVYDKLALSSDGRELLAAIKNHNDDLSNMDKDGQGMNHFVMTETRIAQSELPSAAILMMRFTAIARRACRAGRPRATLKYDNDKDPFGSPQDDSGRMAVHRFLQQLSWHQETTLTNTDVLTMPANDLPRACEIILKHLPDRPESFGFLSTHYFSQIVKYIVDRVETDAQLSQEQNIRGLLSKILSYGGYSPQNELYLAAQKIVQQQ